MGWGSSVMKWSKPASEALTRVPFFVRKRVKRRVEEEAAGCGAREVTLNHVRACQKRFMDRMEDEVRGYQVETCFGSGGCPHRAVVSDGLPNELENRLAQRDLKEFLRERVNGPLKMHHEFRISIADCPNACSRPQIVDIGLIGACRPVITEEPCSQCLACVQACRENAMILDGRTPRIDMDKCLSCGQCIRVCPTGTLRVGRSGYRILLGGKLGRHPRLGTELFRIHGSGSVIEVVEQCLDHFQSHCRTGERFGEILERTGVGELVVQIEKNESITHPS